LTYDYTLRLCNFVLNRSRSTGKERDTESGNDYFGARFVANRMGRFMSPDWAAKGEPFPYAKLDDPQSLNLFAYVRNNPLSRIDADGHSGGKGGFTTDCDTGVITQCSQDTQAAAASQQQAQEQNGSSKGSGFGSRLGHGLSNLAHFHSWGYIKATVTAEDVGPQIPLVTGARCRRFARRSHQERSAGSSECGSKCGE